MMLKGREKKKAKSSFGECINLVKGLENYVKDDELNYLSLGWVDLWSMFV
jgi:hypothetical protein